MKLLQKLKPYFVTSIGIPPSQSMLACKIQNISYFTFWSRQKVWCSVVFAKEDDSRLI